MITCKRLPTLLVGLGLALACPPAHAQSGDQSAARALFAEARKLMKAGQYDAACPKLEAAAKLYTGSGVLLNLADCHEHTGRTTSAWSEFGAAAEAAARTGRADDEAEGRRRQQALEPKLSHLVVHVARPVPGLVVTRNGTELDKGAWDTAIPVDPGTYALAAHATGHAAWSGNASVGGSGATVTIEVPPLRVEEVAARPVAVAEPAATAAPEHGHDDEAQDEPVHEVPAHAKTVEPQGYWTGGRVVAATLTGLGVAGIGVGGAMALAAKSTFNHAEGETGAAQRADSSHAVSAGNVATGVVVGGAALAAIGMVVWLAVPGQPAVVGTNGQQVFLGGTF